MLEFYLSLALKFLKIFALLFFFCKNFLACIIKKNWRKVYYFLLIINLNANKEEQKCKIIEEFMKMKVPSGRCFGLLETGFFLELNWPFNVSTAPKKFKNIYTSKTSMKNFQIEFHKKLFDYSPRPFAGILDTSGHRANKIEICPSLIEGGCHQFAYDSQHKLISGDTINMLHHQVHKKTRHLFK